MPNPKWFLTHTLQLIKDLETDKAIIFAEVNSLDNNHYQAQEVNIGKEISPMNIVSDICLTNKT